MSERAEVEVVLPLEHVPTRDEQRHLVQTAFAEAGRLVAPHGGKVLGLVSLAKAVSPDSELALKVRFAVLVPEHVTERPTVVAVDRKPDFANRSRP